MGPYGGLHGDKMLRSFQLIPQTGYPTYSNAKTARLQTKLPHQKLVGFAGLFAALLQLGTGPVAALAP